MREVNFSLFRIGNPDEKYIIFAQLFSVRGYQSQKNLFYFIFCFFALSEIDNSGQNTLCFCLNCFYLSKVGTKEIKFFFQLFFLVGIGNPGQRDFFSFSPLSLEFPTLNKDNLKKKFKTPTVHQTWAWQ